MISMKLTKVGLFAIIAITAFSSCGKNDYTCACKVGYGGPTPLYENKELGRVSNNRAQKLCNDYQFSRVDEMNGTGNVIQCKVEY
jgi:hypothetical protein